MEILIPLIFVLVIVIVIPLVIASQKRTNAAWADAARKLGLVYEPGGFMSRRRMAGSVRGHLVEVYCFSRGSGKNRQTYTRFSVSHPRSLSLGLRITKEGFLAGITKFFGAQDIEVGDADFDERFLVRGADPRRVIEFLTPARRARLHRVLSAFSGAVVSDDDITWDTRGTVSNVRRIESTVVQLVDASGALSSSRERDAELGEAVAAQHAGRPAEALERVRRVPRSRRQRRRQRRRRAPAPPPIPEREARVESAREVSVPAPPPPPPPGGWDIEVEESEAPDLEALVLEGELLNLAGEKEEAREVFAEALEEAPEDSEIRGWVETLGAPGAESSGEEAAAATSSMETASAAPPGATAPTAQEAPAKPVALDEQSVADALFGEGLSSFDATRIFESTYVDRDVEWSGVLRDADPFTFDFVFGDAHGTKASVEIAVTRASAYSENQVLAVVQLPEDAVDDLVHCRGEVIRFAGRLKQVDGFMKNVYVADARIL